MHAYSAWNIDASQILTRGELAQVLADLKRRSLRLPNVQVNLAIVRLASCCGLRASEIAGLRLGDVHIGVARPFLSIRAQTANPQIQGWAMIGGWALSTPRLMKELDPKKVKVVAVNALPAELPFVENGLAPVLLALPTYNWGYVSVQRIVDKVHLKQNVPTVIPPMEVVRVTKDNLGTWARQLQAWGSTVPDHYLKLK